MVDAADHGAEALAVAGDAADRDAAEVDAVVAALAADETRALALAAGAVIGDRHLERGVDRLRARVGEEHLVETSGGELDQLLGQLERLRVRHVERRREVHLGGLLGDRANDLRPRVSGVDAPQPGDGVEHLSPFRRPVMHPLGLGEKARLALELAAGGKGHPVRVELGRGRARGRSRRRRYRGVGVFVHVFSCACRPDRAGRDGSLEELRVAPTFTSKNGHAAMRNSIVLRCRKISHCGGYNLAIREDVANSLIRRLFLL